jgi:surfeit locus 1 family protein
VRGVALTVVGLVAAVIFLRLGFWQLSRLSEKRIQKAEQCAALQLAPLSLGEDGEFGEPDFNTVAWRRVHVLGRWDREQEFVVRGRAYLGTPGVLVLGVFRPRAAAPLIVLRGWLPAADGLSADMKAAALPSDTGLVSIAGIARPFEPASRIPARTVPYPDRDRVAVGTFNESVLRDLVGEPVLDWVLQLHPDETVNCTGEAHRVSDPEAKRSRSIHRLPLPTPDDGPHALYAFQWFGFAAISLAAAFLLPKAARQTIVAQVENRDMTGASDLQAGPDPRADNGAER